LICISFKAKGIDMLEHYSAIKKNKIMPLAGKWMELEI
jgi:hypothetical protein